MPWSQSWQLNISALSLLNPLSASTMNISTVITHLFYLCILLVAGSSAQQIYLPQLGDSAFHVQSPVMDGREQGESVLLSDFMSVDRSVSEFSGLARSIEGVAALLGDMTKNTTVLAPKNSIITSLPRKPWENPHGEEASAQGAVSDELFRGDSGEDRAARNLEKFVKAHLVGVSPWQRGEENQAKTLGGKTLWWDEDGGVRKVSACPLCTHGKGLVLIIQIYPDGIEVEDIQESVPNGQIWVIKSVITP